jgi:triphosphoribosyl-dephospho-CoA synthetase
MTKPSADLLASLLREAINGGHIYGNDAEQWLIRVEAILSNVDDWVIIKRTDYNLLLEAFRQACDALDEAEEQGGFDFRAILNRFES